MLQMFDNRKTKVSFTKVLGNLFILHLTFEDKKLNNYKDWIGIARLTSSSL